MEVVEEVEDGFGCAACTCSSLDDPQFLFFVGLAVIDLVCSFEISSDGHTIVRFKYLTGCQPSIGRILLYKLSLVIVIPDKRFEVDRSFEFAHLKILLFDSILGLQKYP